MAKQTQLLGLMEEVRQLKVIIKEKDMKMNKLERRVDDLEQYSRMNDLIISGLVTKHQTYARVTGVTHFLGKTTPSNRSS